MMFIEYLLKYVYIFSFLVFMLQNRFLLVYKIVQFRASYLTTCFLESFFYPLHVIKCTCIHYHLYALKLFIFKNTSEVHACLRASTSICQIKVQTEEVFFSCSLLHVCTVLYHTMHILQVYT